MLHCQGTNRETSKSGLKCSRATGSCNIKKGSSLAPHLVACVIDGAALRGKRWWIFPADSVNPLLHLPASFQRCANSLRPWSWASTPAREGSFWFPCIAPVLAHLLSRWDLKPEIQRSVEPPTWSDVWSEGELERSWASWMKDLRAVANYLESIYKNG